tara:strand:- start:912 stop:1214 length:303 start_codon:yes stop_codon:yes gene_type:complete
MLTIALYALAVILTVQQGLDYVSTALIISKGRGSEGNPLIAKWMALSGEWWWIIKLPLVAVIWWLVFAYGPVPMLIAMFAFLAAIYGYVLVNNYSIAWRK